MTKNDNAAVPAAELENVVFTVEQLAQRWTTSTKRIRDLIRTKQLDAFKIGDRRYRIRLEVVQRIEREGLPEKVA